MLKPNAPLAANPPLMIFQKGGSHHQLLIPGKFSKIEEEKCRHTVWFWWKATWAFCVNPGEEDNCYYYIHSIRMYRHDEPLGYDIHSKSFLPSFSKPFRETILLCPRCRRVNFHSAEHLICTAFAIEFSSCYTIAPRNGRRRRGETSGACGRAQSFPNYW